MPHPCEVLPQKKILRDLLHEVDPPPLLDLEQLVRLLCSQQLRLERRVEEGMGCILEEVRQTPTHKTPKGASSGPADCQQESTLASTPNTLQIKPTPATQPPILPDANSDVENQETKTDPIVDNGDLRQYDQYDSKNSVDVHPVDTNEGGMGMAAKSSQKFKETSSKSGSNTSLAHSRKKSSMVANFSSASKKMYNKYMNKQQTASSLSELQRNIQRLPCSSLRSLLMYCTGLYDGVLQVLKRICEHPAFGGIAASFIIFNAVIMAASVDWLVSHDEEAPWMIFCTLLCNMFFIIELAMRLSYQGVTFFTSAERQWNTFDFVMVVLIVVELVTSSSRLNVGQSIKMVKILRIVRIFRLFKFFEELSLMVTMIAGSIKSLVWAWILICIIIFSFSIVLTQFTTFYMNLDKDTPELREQARTYFGTIPRTAYSLVQAMLSGKSWGEFTDVLLYVDVLAVAVFFFYIILMLIAVMNVITGVFVQDAIQAASTQRDTMIAQELRAREQHLENMLEMFTAMDADGSGEISMQEAKDFFRQEDIAAYFSAQGLDVGDAEGIYNILDTKHTDSLPFDEFVEGCFKLKGPAKRTDIAALSQTVDRLYNQVMDFTAILDPASVRTNGGSLMSMNVTSDSK